MKAHHNTVLVEGGRTIQGDVLLRRGKNSKRGRSCKKNQDQPS